MKDQPSYPPFPLLTLTTQHLLDRAPDLPEQEEVQQPPEQVPFVPTDGLQFAARLERGEG